MRVPRVMKTREFTLFVFLVVFVAVVGMRSPRFLAAENIYDVLKDSSVLILASLAQFLVLLTGGIDLSIPSTMALTGMLLGMFNIAVPDLPFYVYVGGALFLGFVLGSFNGIVVSKLRVPPIITTLGTLAMYRALVFLVSGGEWVSAHEMCESFVSIPEVRFLGIPAIIWYALIVFLLVTFFLTYTWTGRSIYATGDNRNAARLVGIDTRKTDYLVFMLSGVISGLAGLLYVTRYAAAQTDSATGYELQAVAACVIGGVSVFGGSGTSTGVLLGALFLGLLYNALTQINISPFYQMLVQGIAILIAILANTFAERSRAERLLKTWRHRV
ncbi:ABC transporter permease [Spirochaeta thermophila]|uniref:Transporter n=1 Tax=Winmispira thermophila (strain ATCC 49972 / DSM 6192 / RI 19.B1) TaxID=665571 RepID=E0RRZ6_WINT6|nr:ABC transporter permease [Spirochaeta thermophila]ADN01783.1 transporter [Spirochaeta thermophila DSM 6192]